MDEDGSETEEGDNSEDNPKQRDITIWFEFSYHKYGKTTDRWSQANYELDEWQKFLIYG
jgi:hypothetical protein